MDVDSNPATAVRQRGSGMIGSVLVLATLVTSIISSFGAPLIPTVARDFEVSLPVAQWSLTVALLTGTVASPVLGRLGDGPRARATLIGGLAVVTVGGVMTALAGSFGVLLVGRVLQGVGLALAPLAMAIAGDVLPPAKAAPMIALLSVSAAAGLGAGYPVSGLLAGAWGLPGAYWFGTAISAFTAVCVVIVIPTETKSADAAGRFDGLGVALLAVALVCSMVGISQGSTWGWGSPVIVAVLLLGAVVLVAWVVQQLHAANPLVQLRLLRQPSVLSGDVCALLLGAAMYMVLTAMTQFVQSPSSGGFGFSATAMVAGLGLIPLAVSMLVSSRALPWLVPRVGVRTVLAAGCLVAGAGSGFFALVHSRLWHAFATTGILGIGLGITFAAIPGLIARSVPEGEAGSAIGLFQVLRFVGYSLGSAVTATILGAHVGNNGQPVFSGYTTTLEIATGVCILAAILAWFLMSRPSPA